MVSYQTIAMELIVLFSMLSEFHTHIFFYLFLSFKNINTTGFKTLEQGQEVEFSIVQGEKGLEAKVNCILNSKSM
jgi:hypothetical protein